MKSLSEKQPWVTYAVVLRMDLDGIRKLKEYLEREGMTLIFDKVSDSHLWIMEGNRNGNDSKRC